MKPSGTVTDYILAMSFKDVLALQDNSYETDDLRRLEEAPQWAKDWDGPFYVEVEASIRAYFDAQAGT